MQKICKIHGLTEYSIGNRPRCRKCIVIAVTKRRQALKRMAVEYKGGKCSECGYNKSMAALQFHHIDPSIKQFNISLSGSTKSWSKIRNELAKCILLCANCHFEKHWEVSSTGGSKELLIPRS